VLADEPSKAILGAARAHPGTAERIRAYAIAREALPEAVSVLALQDLERLVIAASAEPRRLATLTAYVCAPVPGGATLCGGSGGLGLAGLEALRALAFTSTDPQHPLTVDLRDPVRRSWDEIAKHAIPLAQTAPLPLSALPVGAGAPLPPPIGPPYLLVGERGGLWLAGPIVTLTPESMAIDVAPPRASDWPDTADGPYLWIDKDLPAAQLAAVVEGHAWKHPVVVGTDGKGVLIALDVPLPVRAPALPTGAIAVPPAASVQDLVTLSKSHEPLVLVPPPPR
jgi:hypothetical protein